MYCLLTKNTELKQMYDSIGFQNLVVTYYPSSRLRPFLLCRDVAQSWISNASRTFQSNLRSSTFKALIFFQSNPASQNREWLEIPVTTSHHVSSFYFVPFQLILLWRFLLNISFHSYRVVNLYSRKTVAWKLTLIVTGQQGLEVGVAFEGFE